jgi:hypothetical protein
MDGDRGRQQSEGEEKRRSQVSHSFIPLIIHTSTTKAGI